MFSLSHVYNFHPHLRVDFTNDASNLLVPLNFGDGIIHVQLP